VGKNTFKKNAHEALIDDFFQKSNAFKALNDGFLSKSNASNTENKFVALNNKR
jgi:hypothetical protein